ncbi:MAG: hypothetical protein LBI06_05850 [Treponema sp.]|nr:hypothetical protein [Treponema sp.]
MAVFTVSFSVSCVLVYGWAILARHGRDPLNMYSYPYHGYNYYVNADYSNPVINETIKKEFVDFRIWYGIHSSPNMREIIEPNGDMFQLRGPPFYFQIFFPDVSRNVGYVYFKEFILKTDTGEEYNFFDFEDINIRISFARYDKYSIKGEDNAAEIFMDTGKINIGRLIALGKSWLENDIEEIKRKLLEEYKYLPETDSFKRWLSGPENMDIDKLLNEGYLHVIINFKDLPIDVKNNEEFSIRFVFDIVKNNGEVNNFIFDDVYKRTHRYLEGMASFTPPESFGKGENGSIVPLPVRKW